MTKHKSKNIILQFLFLALAILSYITLLKANMTPHNVDKIFHWQRTVDLASDICHGQLPQFNSYTGVPGVADMTFYPWLTMIPLAFLKIMNLSASTTIKIFLIITAFLGLNIAYYSARNYGKSKRWSLFFASTYVISPLVILIYDLQGDTPGYLALMFAPLVWFGWLKVMHNRNSYEMVSGITLMIYTHLLSSFLLLIILGLLTCSLYKQLNFRKIESFIKLAFTTILLTAPVWLPIIILSRANQLYFPHPFTYMERDAFLPPRSLREFFGMNLNVCFATDIIVFIWAIRRWKSLNNLHRHLIICSGLIAIYNSILMPWHFMTTLPIIRTIQFPSRICFVGHLVLCVLGASLLAHSHFNYRKTLVTFLSLALLFTTSANIIHQLEPPSPKVYTDYQPRQTFNPDYIHISTIKTLDHIKEIPTGIIRHGQVSHTSGRINQQVGTRRPNHYYPVPYGIRIYQPMDSKNVIIPLQMYNTQKYYLYLNHYQIKDYHTKDGELELPHLARGHYILHYRTPVMWYRYLSFAMALLGCALIILDKTLEQKKV